ncbi:MAG: hypothetical protein KBG47_01525 [Bacteroidia bacterium]|jgi:hypothetical protein|nr:hypothetical protein [Bacteroidia bacterium]
MRSSIILFLTLVFNCIYSQSSIITINYISHAPFAIKDSTGPKGLEIEIMNEYVLWLKSVKKKDVTIDYKLKDDYTSLVNDIKKNAKSIGLAACITGFEKTTDVEYSAPFLKNVSFCITNGNAPDVKAKNAAEITRALGNMTALTIDKTNLNICVAEIKKLYINDLKVSFLNTDIEILNSIAKNVLYFGYVDAIDFWMYLKKYPNKFLKVQKSLDQTKETFSFILPKGSEHKKLFGEFFISFKAGVKYRLLLEKHLGGFMAQNMAIK